MIMATENGAVDLYHNNEKKLETTANGITVRDDGDEARLIIQGGEGNQASCYWYADEGDDNADKWRIMADTGGDLLIQNYGGGAWDENIKCVANGGVHLYHDDTWKLKVESNGTHLNDSLFINDSDTISIGTGGDLEIYFDGTHSIIDHTPTSGMLALRADGIKLQTTHSTPEDYLICNEGGGVEIYHHNVKKFETTSYGAKAQGALTVHGAEGGNATLTLEADEGDDNADYWQIVSNYDNNDLTFANNTSGSYVNKFTMNTDGSLGLANEDPALYNVSSGTNAYWYEATKGSVQIATTRSEGWSSLYLNKTGTGSGSDDRFVQFMWGASVKGRITCDGTNVAYETSSDYRLKENIVDISDGITRLKQLRPRRFNWIADETNKVQDGFIAHEVSNLIPEAVSGTKDKVVTQAEFDVSGEQPVGTAVYQAMDYGKVTPLLTAALQEAIAKIEVLETKVAALESS
jgi:hypothetical protein